jgi:hypothetical protein
MWSALARSPARYGCECHLGGLIVFAQSTLHPEGEEL